MTCFIALQTVHPDTGPTIWIPGTHACGEAHDRFQRRRVEDCYDGQGLSPKDQLLRDAPSVVGLLPRGSCAIFDSRILHCGTANVKDVAVTTTITTNAHATCIPGSTMVGDSVDNGCMQDSDHANSPARALFYVTFKYPKVGFPGNEGSIGYGLEKASLQLGDVCRICEHHTGSDKTWKHLYRHP